MTTVNNTIRTLLVGLGRIGWSTHLPALIAHPGFKVSAVVDPVEERLTECKKTFGIAGFRTIEEAFQNKQFDLTVIASPTCFHAEQTVCALNNGSHVFCDKPAAMNLNEFQKMKEAAEKNNRILTVFQPMRIDRHNLFLKELISSRKLGKIFLVKMLRERFSCRNDWQAMRKNGGGMLLNYGSHMVDQANYLFNGAGKILTCTADRILSLGDADDVVKLLLRYNDVTVDIDINQAAADSVFRYAVFGSKGSAILPVSGNEWKIRFHNAPDKILTQLNVDLSAPDRKYPADEREFSAEYCSAPELASAESRYYENLYKVLTANEKLLNPLSDTENLIRMIDEAGVIAERNCSL